MESKEDSKYFNIVKPGKLLDKALELVKHISNN